MILVIGARSRTGRELVTRLRESGVPLRTLTRSPEHATSPDAVVGDIAKPDTLDAAMVGVEKVFLLTSPHHDERAWHAHVIDAGVRAGITQLVRSSILGADARAKSRFVRHHGLADEHLKSSGIPFTILRPNFYMHNVTTGWAPTLDGEGNYYAPVGDARISMVDARDVAAVAHAALIGPGHLGRTYDITGPEALSHGEAAERLGKQLGRSVRYVPVDDESARAALRGAGLNEWFTSALIELYQDYRRSGTDGYAARTTDIVAEVGGVTPRTLDRALAEDAAENAADA